MAGSPASEQQLLEFLYAAQVALVQTSLEGEISLVNSLAAALLLPLGSTPGLGNLFTALEGVAPDLRRRVAAFEPDHGLICDGLRLEIPAGTAGAAAPRFLSLTIKRLGADRLIAVLADVTQQVRHELQLLQNEAWSHAVLAGMHDHAVGSIDAEGRIQAWNSSASQPDELFGYTAQALLGQPYSIFYPPGAITPDRLHDRLREADVSGWSLDEGWRLRADASRFWGSTMIVPQPSRTSSVGLGGALGGATGGAATYSLVLRDITLLHQSSAEHRRAGAIDHLTGIANRRSFFEAAELELVRWRRAPHARSLSLVMFDADHFKRINDEHGHPVGDAVLRHLAGLLTRMFRQVDVVARIGGEEFAVLLPSTSLDEAVRGAERLRQAVWAEPPEVDGQPLHFSVSGGVATMHAGLDTLDELVKQADLALYAAKSGGRNRIVAQRKMAA
jgi:diguanylate cyclase (GGDEF)-like protein